MADPKYLYDDSRPQKVTIATAQVTAINDICAMVTGTVVRAADFTWTTDLATTQTAFALVFAGVAAQVKTSTTNARVYGNSEDNVIMLSTAGVFEYDCAAATLEVGDFVGPAKDTGNALLSNKVVKVATAALSIGRVHERGTGITRVKVRIKSALAS